MKAPSLFVSHGAPTFALAPDLLGEKLRKIGASLNHIKAILVVSPHWQTEHIEVLANFQPETIHDFYGFPSELYTLQYPVNGHIEFANSVLRLLAVEGIRASLNHDRGLDHGAWVPLLHMLPSADIPVFQVSMPYSLNAASAYKLGQLLAPMREQGVLILGSGGITHNLSDLRQQAKVLPYVNQFAQWIRNAMIAKNVDLLLAYREHAPNASQAHPTDEHLLPLFVALGASTPDEQLKVIEGGITYGILSMDAYMWQ